jgi:predicted ABC-type ATPase
VAKRRNNIIVESTLSGKSLLPIVSRLINEYQYNIVIVFTYLDNEHACYERVALRVKKGGHYVPFDDVQRRFGRSISNFWNIY